MGCVFRGRSTADGGPDRGFRIRVQPVAEQCLHLLFSDRSGTRGANQGSRVRCRKAFSVVLQPQLRTNQYVGGYVACVRRRGPEGLPRLWLTLDPRGNIGYCSSPFSQSGGPITPGMLTVG